MIKHSFLLILIGFFAISTAIANVCDREWWRTATVPDLEALSANENAFPETCNTWNDTPLHFGAQVCQDPQVITEFTKITNADVRVINIDEKTPLGLAQERLNTSRVLADYAQDTLNQATNDFFRASREASKAHLMNQLRKAVTEARKGRDQANNEKDVAEDIYKILNSQ